MLLTLSCACHAPSTSPLATSASATSSTQASGMASSEPASSSRSVSSAEPAPLVAPSGPDFSQDIVSTHLDLDFGQLRGRARITLHPPTSGHVSFETGDLKISSVTDGSRDLPYVARDRRIDVAVPPSSNEISIEVEYEFREHPVLEGWSSLRGNSFAWPRYCGNLFPCKSDPSDGLTFSLSVYDTAETQYVYPASIPNDAPPYMLAVARGPFTRVDLGVTSTGTALGVWFKKGGERAALAGTRHLRDIFDFYERIYGPYSFGKSVGSVSVDWGDSPYGGMEHHPYWHVVRQWMGDEYTQAHEAAHGWFGDGVRMACLEDFVLSEGTTTYISTRALTEVAPEGDWWREAACGLRNDCTSKRNLIARPPGCNAIDFAASPLDHSDVPYVKGAFFYKAVADLMGPETLDRALSEFYIAHLGKAAHMQDMIDWLETKASPVDKGKVLDLGQKWFFTLDCPMDVSKLCPPLGSKH